jgi:hypothetical protein
VLEEDGPLDICGDSLTYFPAHRRSNCAWVAPPGKSARTITELTMLHDVLCWLPPLWVTVAVRVAVTVTLRLRR